MNSKAAAGSSSNSSKPPSLSRLWELVSEHGSEVRRLSAEHNALRTESDVLLRCLLAAGVLSAQAFEEELRKGEVQRNAARVAASAGSTGGSTGGTITTSSASEALEAPRIAPPQPTASAEGSSAGSFGGSRSSTPSSASRRQLGSTTSGSANSTPQRRLGSGVGRGRASVASTANSSAPSSGPRAVAKGAATGSLVRTSSTEGKRLSSTSPITQRRNNSMSRDRTPPPRSRGASGSPLRRGSSKVAGRDLWELAQPLLEPASSSGEQRAQALSLVDHALHMGAPPTRWQGPDSPLRTAVRAQATDLVRLLLQAKARPDESDDKGVSVLHTASFDGQTLLCKLLMEAKCDSNVADRHGQTPLFFAPTRPICEALVQHKADVNAMNQKAQSALHLAGRAGLGDVLAWLGTRVSKALLEARDMHGATAAYYARHAGIPQAFLIKHRLLNVEPPPPAVGRSALSDTPQQQQQQRQRVGTAGSSVGAGRAAQPASQADWCYSSSLLGAGNERLPPLLEDAVEVPELPMVPDDQVAARSPQQIAHTQVEQDESKLSEKRDSAATKIQAAHRRSVAMRQTHAKSEQVPKTATEDLTSGTPAVDGSLQMAAGTQGRQWRSLARPEATGCDMIGALENSPSRQWKSLSHTQAAEETATEGSTEDSSPSRQWKSRAHAQATEEAAKMGGTEDPSPNRQWKSLLPTRAEEVAATNDSSEQSSPNRQWKSLASTRAAGGATTAGGDVEDSDPGQAWKSPAIAQAVEEERSSGGVSADGGVQHAENSVDISPSRQWKSMVCSEAANEELPADGPAIDGLQSVVDTGSGSTSRQWKSTAHSLAGVYDGGSNGGAGDNPDATADAEGSSWSRPWKSLAQSQAAVEQEVSGTTAGENFQASSSESGSQSRQWQSIVQSQAADEEVSGAAAGNSLETVAGAEGSSPTRPWRSLVQTQALVETSSPEDEAAGGGVHTTASMGEGSLRQQWTTSAVIEAVMPDHEQKGDSSIAAPIVSEGDSQASMELPGFSLHSVHGAFEKLHSENPTLRPASVEEGDRGDDDIGGASVDAMVTWEDDEQLQPASEPLPGTGQLDEVTDSNPSTAESREQEGCPLSARERRSQLRAERMERRRSRQSRTQGYNYHIGAPDSVSIDDSD